MADILACLTEAQKDTSDLTQFKALLAKATVDDLLQTKDKGLNCLHVASSLGMIRHVQLIIERTKESGFVDEVSDIEGQTALMFAIASGPNGHPEIVRDLLKAGASLLI